MLRQTQQLRSLRSLMLGAVIVAGLSGCFCCSKREDPHLKEHRQLAQGLPLSCRNHCFLFFVHGCDPFDSIDMSGLVKRLQTLGYIKTHECQFCTNEEFIDDIRHVHERDPLAHFVLLGEGQGAEQARELAGTFQLDGITIDLLVYLNGGAKVATEKPPANVMQVVNIQGKTSAAEGTAPDHVINVSLSKAGDLGLANHPETVNLLLREFMKVASRVPVIDKVPAADPNPEPTPQPVKPAPEKPRDEWDFLKPEAPEKTQAPPPTAPPGGGPPIGGKK